MSSATEGCEQDAWRDHSDDTYVGRLGKVVERRREDAIEIGLHTEANHVNLSGVVHGGVLMTLFDRTMGINCRAVAAGERMATATLTVDFLRPVRVGDFLRLTCRLKKKGRTAIFADAEAYVGEDLVATATGLWMKVGSSRRG
jgi:uncharacterized protein (TIGR00369 family)